MVNSVNRPYTSQWQGLFTLLSDLRRDYRANLDPSARVTRNLSDAGEMERLAFGNRISGLNVLDIGCGNVPIQLMYFSLRNYVTGIDIHRQVEKRTLSALFGIVQSEGVVRAVKTLGRWTLGIDAGTLKAVARQLNVKVIEWPRVLQMDARELSFSDASFDFVYSRSTFQHLQNPERGMREIARVLRPGGRACITIHLWTCPNGYTCVHSGNPEWPHLRGMPCNIDPSRNRYRLSDWYKAFNEEMPGANLCLYGLQDRNAIERATALQSTCLQSYSIEELTHSSLDVVWKKPSN